MLDVLIHRIVQKEYFNDTYPLSDGEKAKI